MLFEQLLIAGLITGAVYSLVGVGFTLVLGVGKVANFAHGGFVALGLYTALFAHDHLGLNAYETLVPATLVFLVVGFGIGELFEWRARHAGEIGQLLVGLALLLLIGGLLEVLFKNDPRTIDGPTLGHVRVAGLTVHGTEIFAVAFTLATALLIYVVVRRTRWGRAMRAVAENAEAAGLYGIRTPMARRSALAVSIAIAGATGVVISPFTTLTPEVGTSYLISAFAVVILGRIGNPLGAVLAGLALGVVNSLSAGYLASYWTSLAPLLIILLVLLVRPDEGAVV
ncbi:hypothetical protein F8568_025115 [Actinomadura sp. LD22]|uniref:Branched-chain amino acid ABC transporter permease n=1 Tax=Actinomadura physcomitrii TaxID=2650748 RepID=A0A6I4MG97_9ACTN|nr:branched-chain amino acid ABC transporter permease [Actinomadura physcomitrii]MWA03605.1 hypothetical protein [Actinomadura physcomitrii]